MARRSSFVTPHRRPVHDPGCIVPLGSRVDRPAPRGSRDTHGRTPPFSLAPLALPAIAQTKNDAAKPAACLDKLKGSAPMKVKLTTSRNN